MPKVLGGSLETHRRLTRERIFEAFSSLLYERGYDAITLADVAATAGMSRTAIYNYFPDKDALVVGFAEHETERYVTDLRRSLGEIDNPVDRLRAYIRAQFHYFATHHLPPGPALQVLLSEQAFTRVLSHVGSLEQALRDILTEAVDQGYVAPRDVGGTLTLVAACINTASAAKLTSDEVDGAAAETESFVLAALGVRLGADGRPKRLPRRAAG